jgi:hypothetical protein
MIVVLVSMSKSKATEIEKQLGNQIMIVMYRLPAGNHDAMSRICNQFSHKIFKKHGGLHWEVFQLNNRKSYGDIGLTNLVSVLANYVSAETSSNENEEIWVELQYYRDHRHQDEVIARMGKDEACEQLYKQSVELLTPGTSFIIGEFERVNV